MENSYIVCEFNGTQVKGTVLRLQRYGVSFEVPHQEFGPRSSEVLEQFRVFVASEEAYAGRAVVTGLLNLGNDVVCEVKLDEPGIKLGQGSGAADPAQCKARYARWLESWSEQERIPTALKTSVLSLHGYLSELKLLCEQYEISILAHPSKERTHVERGILEALIGTVVDTVDAMRERFLDAAASASPELKSSSQAFISRHLHPLFLCAPFGYRTYHKPLGYAGDYEMMNMIHRNGFEGGSLYAKLVHHWLVNQPPAKSVRVRVGLLEKRLGDEVARAALENRPARILNVGCGPAQEVQQFLASHPLADRADITLLDFDAETLHHATQAAERAKTASISGRAAKVQSWRMSAAQLIRESSQPGRNPLGQRYDFIYCGGLFDYFSPRVCKQLTALFYANVAAGGLVLVANMYDKFRPFSAMLEYLLDWHLIYRSAEDLKAFVPADAPQGVSPISEDGINLFIELRKPRM